MCLEGSHLLLSRPLTVKGICTVCDHPRLWIRAVWCCSRASRVQYWKNKEAIASVNGKNDDQIGGTLLLMIRNALREAERERG